MKRIFKAFIFICFISLSLMFATSCETKNNSGSEEMKKEEVQVLFQSGEELNIVFVEKGLTVAKPEDPTREGFQFLGWYYNNQLYDFDTIIENTILISARWEEIEVFYNVTFNVDGEREVFSVQEGSLIYKPVNPTKEGYMFKGWTYMNHYWDFDKDIVDKNIEITAKFIAIEDLKKVTFDCDGTLNVVPFEEGNYITQVEEPTKEYFDFDGWYLNDTKWNFESDRVVNDITLVAHWKLKDNACIVKFNVDGVVTNIYAYKSKLIGALEIPTKEGYEFVGWFDGDNQWDFKVNTPKSDIELVAKWNVKQYKITLFDYYGIGKTFVYNCNYGEVPTKILKPEREFYNFAGMYTESNGQGEKVTLKETPAHDVSLYVYWLPVEYEITYVDGGTHDNQISYNIEDKNFALNPATKETAIFDGWYTSADYSERIDHIYTNECKQMTIYAKWNNIPYPTFDQVAFTYNKENQNPILSNLNTNFYTISGDTSNISDAGSYQITCTLLNGAKWVDDKTEPFVIDWKISEIKLDYPMNNDEFIYDGKVKSLNLTYNEEGVVRTGSVQETNAGAYQVTFKLNKNYSWVDGKKDDYTIDWTISKCKVAYPVKANDFDYDGEIKTVNLTYNQNALTIVSGSTSETNAGSYELEFKLKDNYCWLDETSTNYCLTWAIHQGQVEFPSTTSDFIYDGTLQKLIYSYDESKITIVKGTTEAILAGSYTIEFKLMDNFSWIDGTTDNFILNWKIKRRQVMYPVGVSSIVYNGESQNASIYYDEATMKSVTGDLAGTNAGKYSITFELTDNYTWKDESTAPYTIDWEITPLPIGIPTVTSSLTYNGKAQTPTFDLGSYADNITVTAPAETNAGTYSATFETDSNHIWNIGGARTTIDWTIERAEIVGMIQERNIGYNGKVQYPEMEVWASGYLTATCTFKYSEKSVKPGRYAIAAIGTGNFTGVLVGSYDILKEVATLELTQDSYWILAPSSNTITYDITDFVECGKYFKQLEVGYVEKTDVTISIEKTSSFEILIHLSHNQGYSLSGDFFFTFNIPSTDTLEGVGPLTFKFTVKRTL